MQEKICNVILNLYDNTVQNTYFQIYNADINAYKFRIYLQDKTNAITNKAYDLTDATNVELVFKIQQANSSTSTILTKSANIVDGLNGLCDILIYGDEFSVNGTVTCYVKVETVSNSNASFVLTFTPFTFSLLNNVGSVVSSVPIIISASTSSSGSTVNINFSKSMNDPTSLLSDFSVSVNGTVRTISSISYGNSKSSYVLSLSSIVNSTDIVTLTTTGTITGLDGTVFVNVINKAVLNTVTNVSASDVTLNTSTFTQNLDSSTTDVQKLAEKVDKLSGGGSDSTYTNTVPTWISIGGIGTGSTFSNKTMSQMWTSLLYPYTAPVVGFSTNPVANIQEYGTNISSVILSSSIVKKSNNITKIDYYKNNSIIKTNTFTSIGDITDSYTDSSGTNDTTNYYIAVTDNKPNVTNSSNIVFTYVYPFYIGSLNVGTPTESIVKAMTKRVVTKSNQSMSYTITSAYPCIAYPTGYSDLTSILDINGFEMISSFNKSTIDFTMADSKVVNYTVFILNSATTQSDFIITYKF